MKRHWSIEIKGKYLGKCYATEAKLRQAIQNANRAKRITFSPNLIGNGGYVCVT